MSHRPLHRQQGFTLLELALVLLLMGGMALIVISYQRYSLKQQDAAAQGYQDQIAAALYRYANRHYRLPCADTNGNGHEAGSSGQCQQGKTAHMVGGVPFLTLGMTAAQELNQAARQRYVYGVFRDDTPDTDLTALVERTDDSLGDSGYLSRDDLRYALRQLGQRSLDTSRIYVTGDNQQAGTADCNGNPIANLAFFVAYAGTRDGNGNGQMFDGENASLSWPSSSGLCVSGPLTGQEKRYDDTVIAVGFAELLGYLSR